MKISIINPNLVGDVSGLDLGIAYLATYINERTKHKAEIIDFTYHRKNWEQFLHKKIKLQKPDIIGMSAVTLSMHNIRKILKEIKIYHPNLRVIMGGWHPTINPEESIKEPLVDAICIGNGEYTLGEYLNKIEKNKSLKGVKGIWYKEKGKIIRNSLRPLIQDIDSLPIPNFDLWEDLDKYFYFLGQGYFMGTKGCPFNCVVEGTEIMIDNYKVVKAEDFQKNPPEKVVSFKDNKLVKSKVLANQKFIVDELIEIETQTGEKLTLTPDHKVWTRRGWIEASNLKDDDEVSVYDK